MDLAFFSNGGNSATVYDIEAFLIEQCSDLEEMGLDFTNSAEQKRLLSNIDTLFRNTRSQDQSMDAPHHQCDDHEVECKEMYGKLQIFQAAPF